MFCQLLTWKHCLNFHLMFQFIFRFLQSGIPDQDHLVPLLYPSARRSILSDYNKRGIDPSKFLLKKALTGYNVIGRGQTVESAASLSRGESCSGALKSQNLNETGAFIRPGVFSFKVLYRDILWRTCLSATRLSFWPCLCTSVQHSQRGFHLPRVTLVRYYCHL